MQQYTFAGLVRLSETNPPAYREEIERLRLHDTERLDAFVDWFRGELEKVTGTPRRRESLLALFLGATTPGRV